MSLGLDPSRKRLWQLLALGLLCLGGVMSWSSSASAYPWMIRYGFGKCGTCHTDPSGGEVLTDMGRVQSDALLSTRWGRPEGQLSGFSQFLYGAGNPAEFRLGGSFRYAALLTEAGNRTFPMQADFYGSKEVGDVIFGGSVGASRVDVGSPHARRAQLTTGQGGDLNLVSRNHYVGFKLDENSLLRAGRLNIPFGLRIPEHTMWVREATRTDRESDQLHGFSIHHDEGRWRGELMAIFGNFQVNPDEFRERGYSGYLELFISPTATIGVSSLHTQARRDVIQSRLGRFTRSTHGLMTRVGVNDWLGVMAEADVIKNTGSGLGYVGFTQVNVEPFQGLQLTVMGEAQNRGTPDTGPSGPGAGELQLGTWVGANWFFASHFDIRADYIIREETDPILFLQFHSYL